jgi:predicted PurR-regulated permease PerM
MDQSLDISWKTIVKVLITGFSLYILFLSREIVIWFFFALIIALLVQPAVNLLKKFKMPKTLAVRPN